MISLMWIVLEDTEENNRNGIKNREENKRTEREEREESRERDRYEENGNGTYGTKSKDKVNGTR
jgi:hypothetical protein